MTVFGGGSFEFYIQNKYNLHIVANDAFTPLYNFWSCCKSDKLSLTTKARELIGKIDKTTFLEYRGSVMNEVDNVKQSVEYFVINRCSFSGATLSGGFSKEAASNRFTLSSVSRVENLNLSKFSISNLKFEDFIVNRTSTDLMFLDPPYYLESKSKLYGNNGDMHEHFEHQKLYNIISTQRNWIMTYNNCEYIRELYKDFKIIETNWTYGMNSSKKSSEIVIIALE